MRKTQKQRAKLKNRRKSWRFFVFLIKTAQGNFVYVTAIMFELNQ